MMPATCTEKQLKNMATYLISQGKMCKSLTMQSHHKERSSDILDFVKDLVTIGKQYSEYDYDKWIDFFHENAIKEE